MPGKYQFGLTIRLLLLMLVMSVTFAALRRIAPATLSPSRSFYFIVMMMAGPLVTMVVFSLVRGLFVKKKKRRQRPPP